MESSVRLATDVFPLVLEPLGVGGGVGKPVLSPRSTLFFAVDTVVDAAEVLVVGCPFLRMNLLAFVFLGDSLFGVLALSCK